MDLHVVIKVLDNPCHQILPTPKLAEMVEGSENFEFFHQSEEHPSVRLCMTYFEYIILYAFFVFAECP
jgi:hypothetical protein